MQRFQRAERREKGVKKAKRNVDSNPKTRGCLALDEHLSLHLLMHIIEGLLLLTLDP